MSVTREPPFCHSYTSFCVWLRDHNMGLQRLTLDRISCFAIGFPYFGQQNTRMPLLQLQRFSHIGYNRITSHPSCTLRPYRYSHTSPPHPARQLTIAFLISQQVIPYRTCGGTCCPEVSTPKIRSLADLSNHMPWRYQPSPPFYPLLKPYLWSSPWSTHVMIDGRPNTITKT
jgi:hypothetical protein